jgi:dihydroorotate dehydrogenase
VQLNIKIKDFPMITLSNGQKFEYMVASGSLAFKGQGWFWDWPLVLMGLVKPELFTVVIKTLTYEPRRGNLIWWKPWTWFPFSPWSCVRFIPGGSVNKVGLTNSGIDWWRKKVGPKIDFGKYPIVGSIFGNGMELVEMAKRFNNFDLVALEINPSCPNTGHAMETAETVVRMVKAATEVSRHPVIIKVSVDQDYLTIARGLQHAAEAVSLNSVPWKTAFPNGELSPLWRLERKVGGGGGGVSGKPAQKFNWAAVEILAKEGPLPVIGPDIMEYEDLERVRKLGASAISFGAIHLQTPWKPTAIVEKELALRCKGLLV